MCLTSRKFQSPLSPSLDETLFSGPPVVPETLHRSSPRSSPGSRTVLPVLRVSGVGPGRRSGSGSNPVSREVGLVGSTETRRKSVKNY